MRKNICVFTGSRAEYGLLLPLLKLLKKSKQYRLQLLVSGMHFSAEHGSTYQFIEDDGFVIDEKVEMLLAADSDAAIIKSVGLGMIGYADSLEKLRPSAAVVLGDRFEAFAFATAAYLSGIPLIHLHGGEITEAASDDSLRHAITKMAFYHFTSTAAYRKRVIQLGEAPARVFNTGAIGLDNIKNLKLLSRKELYSDLGLKAQDNFILVTYHPVTLAKKDSNSQFQFLLKALEKVKDYKVIFTMPNADAANRSISESIKKYVLQNPDSSAWFTSLGQLRYLSAMKHCSLVLGNSSSGIIEAPSFGVPTVNIGNRQKGRVFVKSIIQAGNTLQGTEAAIKKALSPSFQSATKKVKSPYGNGDTAQKIMKILDNIQIPNSVIKKFYDL